MKIIEANMKGILGIQGFLKAMLVQLAHAEHLDQLKIKHLTTNV